MSTLDCTKGHAFHHQPFILTNNQYQLLHVRAVLLDTAPTQYDICGKINFLEKHNNELRVMSENKIRTIYMILPYIFFYHSL